MAIANLSGKTNDVLRAPASRDQRRCIMCEGTLEKSNFGMICNDCKDKMRK